MRDPQVVHGKPVVTPEPPPVMAPEPQKTPDKAPIVPKPVAAPIELVYRCVGQCSQCYGAVEAIEVELEKENMIAIIAWCSRCKKKLKQFTAPPIGSQKEKKDKK